MPTILIDADGCPVVEDVYKRQPFRAVRMAWDAAWVVLTLVLGGSVGPVTIGIMLLMGPAVDLVGGWAKRTLYRG